MDLDAAAYCKYIYSKINDEIVVRLLRRFRSLKDSLLAMFPFF